MIFVTSLNYLASQRPVFSSQNPSRPSRRWGGALRRGEEGEPYAFLRLFPQPRLFLVSTPVNGFVPFAYLHRAFKKRWRTICKIAFSAFDDGSGWINVHVTCFWRRSITASLKSAPSILAPPRSLRVRTDRTSTAFVRFASFST